MNQLLPVVTKLMILLGVPFFVEAMSLKQTLIQVSLMFVFTVQALESIRV